MNKIKIINLPEITAADNTTYIPVSTGATNATRKISAANLAGFDNVSYLPQEKSGMEMTQARANIGAAAKSYAMIEDNLTIEYSADPLDPNGYEIFKIENSNTPGEPDLTVNDFGYMYLRKGISLAAGADIEGVTSDGFFNLKDITSPVQAQLDSRVSYLAQEASDSEKLQARTNIDAQKRIEKANQSVVAGPGAWPNADIQQEGDNGYGNVALGVNAGNKLTTGSANSLIGNGVGEKVTTGNNNIAIGGTFALSSNVSGNENSAMGVRALSSILGSGHVGVGAYAGYKSGYNATGDNSVFIGRNATRKNNTTTNNEIVIGANAVGNGDNSMTLGHTNITDTRIRGEIDSPVFKNGFKLKRKKTTVATGTVNYDPGAGMDLIQGVGTNFSSFNVGDTFVFENGGEIYEVPITYISSDTAMSVFTLSALGDEAYGVPYTIVPQEIVDIDMALYPSVLKYATNAMNFNARVLPKVDDYYTLGSTSQRWSQLYAGTTTIATSDARLKTVIVAFTQDELNAAKQLSKEIGTYKFLSAIAEKGESARKHIGMTVQRAIEIMQANNLNPFEYGFICFDSWDDEYKTIPAVEAVEAVEAYVETVEHDNGVIEKIFHDAIPAVEAKPEQTIKIKSAGEIYSFRYEELLAFICRGFEVRLSALE